MRVPTINELQDLWVYKRVNQYYDEHRPAPDHSLFVDEFKTAMDQIKADAWEEGAEALEHHQMHVSGGWPNNPYRKQEEA